MLPAGRIFRTWKMSQTTSIMRRIACSDSMRAMWTSLKRVCPPGCGTTELREDQEMRATSDVHRLPSFTNTHTSAHTHSCNGNIVQYIHDRGCFSYVMLKTSAGATGRIIASVCLAFYSYLNHPFYLFTCWYRMCEATADLNWRENTAGFCMID